MGDLVVSEFITLDGVFEEPERWSIGYWCDGIAAFKHEETFAAAALLLGRRTYEVRRLSRPPAATLSTSRSQPRWQRSSSRLRPGPGNAGQREAGASPNCPPARRADGADWHTSPDVLTPWFAVFSFTPSTRVAGAVISGGPEPDHVAHARSTVSIVSWPAPYRRVVDVARPTPSGTLGEGSIALAARSGTSSPPWSRPVAVVLAR
jgi:hypothetical protein